MFERLIDLLIQTFVFFIPFVVIDHFERAVVLRFGVIHRQLEPGFHWIIPFQVERVVADNVVPRTHNLLAQSLTTKDGKNIVLGAVVTLEIYDVQLATMEVEAVDDAVQDACYGAIGLAIAAHDYDEIRSEDFPHELAKLCRRAAKAFGIHIIRVQLSDLTIARTIRLQN